MLLTLADEYITAARALLPLDEDDALWKRYFRLMAMGIGCLEAVLKVSASFASATSGNATKRL